MFLGIDENRFVLGGKPLLLRSVGLGNWLNLEHFMLGIPGTDSEIRAAIRSCFGEDASTELWQCFYLRYIDEADIRFIKELGLNSVRIPVNAKLFFTHGSEIERSLAIQELDRVLALCERLAVLAVIDLHAAPGGQNPDWHSDNASGEYRFWKERAHRDEVVRLWSGIAEHYQRNRTVAGFDIINEPCYFETELDAVLLDFYEQCIRAIRRYDEHHIIFLEGNTYARDFSMIASNLDENLAYSFHYYPFLQLSSKLNERVSDEQLEASLFEDVTLAHLVEKLQRPIWCGETGHPSHLPKSYSLFERYLALLEKNGISWALWTLKDIGSMGMLFPIPDGDWAGLVGEVSEEWSFWNVFTEDSLVAASRESDKHVFYKRLAQNSSDANRRFARNLCARPFETLLQACDDWRFDRCKQAETLIGAVQSSTRGSAR